MIESGKEAEKLRITTLIENHPNETKELSYEHGLSLLIEADGKRILFDSGQSGAFIQNAKILHQNLENLDYVVLSHGHYDHSGGFYQLVKTVKHIPHLIVGEEFFRLKYKTKSEGQYQYNGNSFREEFLNQYEIPITKVTGDILHISEHIMIFHHFHKITEFENTNSKFLFKENATYRTDDFADEIAIGVVTKHGLTVMVGCSHIGIINILKAITQRTKLPICAVIGGTHLIEADEERIHKTIQVWKEMNIKQIAVSHCTGELGISCIQRELPNEFFMNNTGKVIEI